ncbi:MAG TPA: AMP-binding protein [Sporichthyaceae bacterium]|jgi:fatty-acyl-CoA synthase|nr:AMP-binding protein [Sporichthyaceae bacterium]
MIDQTIGGLLERAARAYGPRTAIIAGDRRITYTELMSEVRRTGRALLAAGLERGDRVAMLMPDRPEVLYAYYGALWAGLGVVPINARLGAEDQSYMISDSGARALIHDATYAERLSGIVTQLGTEVLAHRFSVDPDAVLDAGTPLELLTDKESGAPGMPTVSPEDLFGIYYTGGTTGRPKGVVHTHRSFGSALFSELLELGLGEADVFAHCAPLTHASGGFVLPVWMRGGTNLVLGGFDPDRLLAAIATERVTATLLVPTMIYVLLDHPEQAFADTSSLRTVVYGAAPMGTDRLVEALHRFGPIFAQLYGQTEAPNQLTVLRKDDHAEALRTGDLTPLSSCGRPVAIADVRLLDDDLNEVPLGSEGEICARGPHIMAGYWNRPEETAAALRDGWLCTGDVARSDERGFLYIVDRKKDMIISGGYNVYPKEVEAALFTHPAVRDACVIGVPDDKWGEAVKAVVVLDPAVRVDAATLIDWVKAAKGSVNSPKTVDFVDAIPLTAVGKHDKPALRKQYWGGRDRAVN